MLVPLVLLVIAVGLAGMFTYGVQPQWVGYAHGLGLILFSRQWQWALVSLSLLACLVLVALVIAGRRRSWWLLGLAPVLALFIHHFSTGPFNGLRVVDEPQFVQAGQSVGIGDEDWVVGVMWGEQPYAYPYAALFTSPVILVRDHDQRMILMWSAYANQAMAFEVTRELKARDLEPVSMPADALLLYDTRTGQFINALTGQVQTSSREGGGRPIGFKNRLVTGKMRWKDWKLIHPQTLVLSVPIAQAGSPVGPILPHDLEDAGSGKRSASAPLMVTLVGNQMPVAVVSDSITHEPMNLVSGPDAYLVFREPVADSVVGFSRVLEGGLYPRFVGYRDPRKPSVAFKDTDTASLWTLDGRAVEGELKGTRLKRVLVEDQLYWSVMSYWYPDLQRIHGEIGKTETAAPVQAPPARGANRRRMTR